MRNILATLFTLAMLLVPVTSIAQTNVSPPFTQCPAVGADKSCAILVVVTDSGVTVVTDPTRGPYDAIEDTLIGVQNNSTSKTVFSLPLSSPNPIFSFDGDGICGTDPNTLLPFVPAPPGCPFGPTGYEGPGVSFSSINANATSGTVNFAGGIPPGGSAYFSLELAIQTLCSPIAGVPLQKQAGNTAPWALLPYDHLTGVTDTIKKWGCYLTSCSMIIDYHAAAQGVPFSTDPGLLNTWLNGEQDGYDSDGNVNPYACARYARSNGIKLFYQLPTAANDFVLDNYLCSNDPVMLKVAGPNGDHFVVATGQTLVNGKSTFLINDPGYNQTDLSGYQFQYSGIRPFASADAIPSALVIRAHSPIELLVTDPNGLKSGKTSTGASINEIPASSYGTEALGDDENPGGQATLREVKVFEIQTPIDGVYNVQAIGTGIGSYTLEFLAYDANGAPSKQVLTGSATVGIINAYNVTYSSLAGSQIAVAPAITLSLSPGSSDVPGNTTAQFTANVSNDPTNAGVSWSVSGAGCSGVACGTVTPSTTASGIAATYTAPSVVPSIPTVTVTATSAADPTKSTTATITITPNYTLTVSTASPAIVSAGQSATASITLTPQAGTSGGSVSLNCTVQPATTAVGCNFSSAPVTLGSGPTTVGLTITTTTAAATIIKRASLRWSNSFVFAALACLLMVFRRPIRKPRRSSLLTVLGLLAGCSLFQIGCGGKHDFNTVTTEPPPRTFTVIINASPAPSGPSSSITLTVK